MCASDAMGNGNAKISVLWCLLPPFSSPPLRLCKETPTCHGRWFFFDRFRAIGICEMGIRNFSSLCIVCMEHMSSKYWVWVRMVRYGRLVHTLCTLFLHAEPISSFCGERWSRLRLYESWVMGHGFPCLLFCGCFSYVEAGACSGGVARAGGWNWSWNWSWNWHDITEIERKN